jgi:hypothetical protein
MRLSDQFVIGHPMVQYKESYRKGLEEIPQLPLLSPSEMPLECYPLEFYRPVVSGKYLGWKGPSRSLVKHGPATIEMGGGLPNSIFNALSETGERVKVNFTFDGRWRYAIKAPERFKWCDVDFLSDDIHVKDKFFSIQLDDHEQKFHDFLHGYDDISTRVRSEFTFAVVLENLLSLGEWRNGEEAIYLRARDGGSIVAKLRGCGNSYHDFFMWTPSDFELEEGESWPDWKSILQLLNSYGWTRR